MPRNTIYYKEWKEKDWSWRLEFVPADSEFLDSPTYELIPSEALNIIDDLQKKFPGDLPIGIIAAEDIKIEFDLRWLPWDMIEYVNQPILSKAGIVEVSPIGDEDSYVKYFDLTNVCRLKTDRGTGGALETIFVGCQKRSIKSKTKITPDGIQKEITIISLIKVILENISATDVSRFIRYEMWDNNDYGYYVRDLAFDLIWKKNSNYYAKADCGPYSSTSGWDYKAWFVNMRWIDYAIQTLIWGIGEQFIRIAGDYCEFTNNAFYHWNFHKQNILNESHQFGDNVAYEDLYFIGFVTRGSSWALPEQVGGFLVEDKNAPTLFDYDNMWDYLRAIAEANYCKLSFPINAGGLFDVEFERVFETYYEPVEYLDLDDAVDEGNAVNPEFEDGERVIKKAQGNIKGLGDKDVSELYTEAEGSLAETDFEFKAVFHNLPTQIEGYDGYSIRLNDEAPYEYIKINMDVLGFINNKLYYMDTMPGFDEVQAIKIHEYVSMDDGICTWVMSPPEIELGEYFSRYYYDWYLNPKILNLQSRETSNMVSLVAYAASTTFSIANQALYKPKYELETGITIDNVGDVVSINWGVEYLTYKDDVPEDIFRYHLAGAVIMSAKMKLKSEIVETEMFVRGLGEGV